MAEVRIGMLGSGFIGEFHTQGLRYIPDARVVANWGAGPSAARRSRDGSAAGRSTRSTRSVRIPRSISSSSPSRTISTSRPSVRQPRHGKGVACTKPLGRNGDEAAEMLRLVTEAGVFHAYLENVIFNAEMIRMREMIESGAIGRLTTFRAREGHSGPHAAHFWDAELAGGGALLDMASHGAEAARAMFGKDVAVRDVFAWGDTLVHNARTTLEDNAVMLIRFEDGRVATMDVSWSSKGGLESRFEAYGEGGRIVQDIISSPLRAFIEKPAGYLGEKVDADTGWVYPVPNETYAHGHDAMMADVVEAFRDGRPPQETFEDGLIVNRILDAAYRSIRSGQWEAVERSAQVAGA